MPSSRGRFPSARTATGTATRSASIILASRCCSRRASSKTPTARTSCKSPTNARPSPSRTRPTSSSRSADDGKGGFVLILNDDTREALDPSTLEVGADNVLYARVKGGTHRARFLRSAYYHLSTNFESDGASTIFHTNWRQALSSETREQQRFQSPSLNRFLFCPLP